VIEAIIRAPGHVEVREVGESGGGDLRPDEALVEVKCVGLCGSDYKLFQGAYGGPSVYPLCFGHEWSGTVVRSPSGARIPEGTDVTGDCSAWCGRCAMCEVDKNLCQRIDKFGITTDGFSRQFRAVPERYLYPNAAGLDYQTLALTEACAVVLHGVRKAVPLPDAPAVIVGAGVLGVMTYLALRELCGAPEADFVEPVAERRAFVAGLLPAARFVPAPAADGRPLSYDRMGAIAAYGLAFECAGSHEGLNTALALTRSLGTVVCFGLGRPGPVDTHLLVTKSLRILGSVGGTGEFPEAMRFLATHRESFRRLITHRYRVDQAQEAFERTLHDPTRFKVQMEY
jgi:L-iditol 2-dehydrogenase